MADNHDGPVKGGSLQRQGGKMRKIAVAVVLAGLLSGSVHAQSIQQRQQERGGKVDKTPMQLIEEERERRARDVEKDYEAAMKRSSATPTQKAVVDPWRNVRPNQVAPGDK
jgi:hypothetical protein